MIDHVRYGGKFSDKKLMLLLKKHFQKIPSDYFTVVFLDNHDMDRFLRHCNGDIRILLDAFKLLFSLNCPVVIYNGTENCTYNKQPVNSSISFSDLMVREPFDWHNINQDFLDELRVIIQDRSISLPDSIS